MTNGIKNIDLLILLNDLQQIAQPSSTAVNISNPQGDFFKNQPKNLANGVGSIGGLSEKELLDIAMSVSPIGASMTGGKVAKSTLHQLLGLMKKTGVKPPKGITAGDLRGKGLEDIIEGITDKTSLSQARIQNQKILQGKGSTGKIGKFHTDPDKQGMVDPVTALLNYFSKN